jgi:copper homeostasis protein
VETPPIVLEACVDSLEAALAAEAAGADRIELCSALELGGITPSPALIHMVCARLRIPVQVLLRPRGGGFVYSAAELEVMAADAAFIARQGASGLVTGALDSEGSLNQTAMQALIKAAGPVPVTFHRAFDQVADPRSTVRALVELGVERVLSSGQAASALGGGALLRDLQTEFGQEIVIMPGGGVNADNLVELARITGCREFHFSAVRAIGEPTAGPNLGKGGPENMRLVPFPEKVQAMRGAAATIRI